MSVPDMFKEFLTVFENFEKCRRYWEFSKNYGNFTIKYEISLNFPRFSRIMCLPEIFKEFLTGLENFKNVENIENFLRI
jgi:hypothetical protein